MKKKWEANLETDTVSLSAYRFGCTYLRLYLLIYKQLGFVKHSDPGFNNELLLRINIPYNFRQANVLGQELDKLPFVSNSTFSSGCPGMINHRMDSDSEGKSITVNCIYVGDNYLNTMDMELLKGRDFLEGDLKKACLINEEAF